MGNYQFKVDNPPTRGQIMTVRDSQFTSKQEYPKSVMYQGSKVKVLGSKDLLCSRPSAPKVTASLVQLPSGQKEVFLSNNLG
jgi:hypothetical protein